jgi:hypothetical protein
LISIALILWSSHIIFFVIPNYFRSIFSWLDWDTFVVAQAMVLYG